VAGVPEHFNSPWTQAIPAFATNGLNVQWRECTGGTGEMVSMLREAKVDVALLLTEGAVKAAAETPDKIKLVALYVRSPLLWGIHASAKSKLPTDLKQLALSSPKSVKFAISRKGSGSHLMAFVLAKQLGWDLTQLSFLEVGNLEGARHEFAKDLKEAKDLIFLWEKAMTQPYVTKKEVKRLGEIPTPWPCFLLAATPETVATKSDLIQRVLSVVQDACHKFKADKPSSVAKVMREYGLEHDSVIEWFDNVEFASLETEALDPEMLQKVYETLVSVKMLPSLPKSEGNGSAAKGLMDVKKLVSKL